MSRLMHIFQHTDTNSKSPIKWTFMCMTIKHNPLKFAYFEHLRKSLIKRTFLCTTNAIKIIENELCTINTELCNHSNSNAINLIAMQLNTGVVHQNDDAKMVESQCSQGIRRITVPLYRFYIYYKLIIYNNILLLRVGFWSGLFKEIFDTLRIYVK